MQEVSSQLKNRATSQLVTMGDKLRQKFGSHLPSALKEEGWQDSKLQQKLAHAGYRTYTVTSLLLSVAVICTLLGLAGGLIFSLSWIAPIQPVGIVLSASLGAVIGVLIPVAGLELLIRRRQRQLVEHFPDALDLVRICLEAGLGLDAAIQRVGQEFRQVAPALFDEFHVLSLELRAGAGRARALQNLAQRTGLAEIRAWVTMIIQSEKFGTGIADAVKIHSDQLRLTRRLNAEQRAATLPTKLLFPLIFCIFPALLLVLLGPAGITIQQQLGHTLEERR
jgi:tight adherence protein C